MTASGGRRLGRPPPAVIVLILDRLLLVGAGYPQAVEAAKRHGIKMPMLK